MFGEYSFPICLHSFYVEQNSLIDCVAAYNCQPGAVSENDHSK